jgi:hypothetical protein
LTGIARVQPHVREALGQTTERGGIQQELDALPVLDLGAVDPSFEHQSLRIHQEMPLASLNLLSSVVTTLVPTHARGLDRLAIHDGRRWVEGSSAGAP